MSEFLHYVISVFSNFTIKEWIVFSIIVLILLMIILKKFFNKFYQKYLFKFEDFIRPLTDEAVKRSAEYLNSSSGQEKLDAAIKYVQDNSKNAPWYFKIFLSKINKSKLVDIIEKSYKTYKETINSQIPDEVIDIKGNEIKKK